ncbi:putative lipid II flippase FtsW [bacterium]|nr:putative lipid II flippase FtsW [bacterium]MBU3955275.1 putative lipid II flippase FtsW [bacterium]MBU4134768.1 putative lipid II flippase FtsW [bacterium]
MGKKSYLKEVFILVSYFLSGAGLIMILDITSVTSSFALNNPYHYFLRQLMWLAASSVIFFALWEIDIKSMRRAIPWAMLAGVIALIAILIPGVTHPVKGARRWLFLPGAVAVQPSEFLKVVWVMYLADYLDRHRGELDDYKILTGPLILLFALLALVYSQPDFGSTLMLIALFLIVFFLAEVPVSRLIAIVLTGLPFAYWAVFGTSYRKDRITAFLEPFKYSSDEGYQLTRSLIAVVSGGILGKGAGSSTSKLMYLPCAHTDFIFSVICEEFGIIGSSLILLLFVIFVIIGFEMAKRCRDKFSRILVGGLTSLIALGAFANIAVCLGLLPTKGLALPFMSYGGSNLMATYIMLGLIISVYMESAERMLG